MSRLLLLIVIGLVAGLVVGYFIFAQIGGEYIPVKTIIALGANEDPANLSEAIQSLGNSIQNIILDIETIRRNILISGLVGAIAGALLFGLARGRKS
ncbi:hypothetical protein [Salinispira pacifica]|uniref:Uncharacterized protein n=1 Tax=Salinispira pacifica TaxID=1307761 RepID=V5WLD3_9SPIO|nr:hypothetical protein [Salinispira pacifica]AHC16374.1 hypothetical protein L21SP2_3030 [Salinispira pacifica]